MKLSETELFRSIPIKIFSAKLEIEFRDPNDLTRILHTHSLVLQAPYTMCVAGPSSLLYADGATSPLEVHWLDLSGSEPKPAVRKRVIHLQQANINDMCFAQDGDKQLLVVADINEGLFAYNTETDKLKWSVKGKQPGMDKELEAFGVTTDGSGHLFVCDWINGNRCIQMFAVSNGQYLGCLMKDMKALGDPGKIWWCEKTRTLVAACELKAKWCIYVIDIQF